MKTVHLILNAHLDPVWLWSWRDGLDEVLNTSHAICNLLDRHPDIIYTRGEAWVYEQIQRVDPPLFSRIQAHVRKGRWSLVGGWYLQPDCNLPSGFALERHIALGRDFFLREFGEFPKVGYNVDSFGHAATLPGYLQTAGQSAYVMMRPQEHEMKIPARLFRWQGWEGGPEVTTFRVAQAYCTSNGMNEEHLLASLTELPDGISHTMCFVGIGDHGGGPTEEIIEWCRAHRDSFPGVRLEFSSPERFFQAIQFDLNKLPLVVGELQQHAIGCYSVHRAVKVGVRRAEHRLVQAEIVSGSNSGLQLAWKKVCFNHFHDTLGGTCLPSAYEDVSAELGFAIATADEVATISLRQQLATLPEDPAQRLIFFQASESVFDDFVEIEPWMEWTSWQPTWSLVDEIGERVPLQILTPETAAENQVRLLLPLKIQPAERRVLRIVEDSPALVPFSQAPQSTPHSIPGKVGLLLGNGGCLRFDQTEFALPELILLDDATDTWSHGISSYPRNGLETAVWQSPRILEKGPLLTSLFQFGKIGSSELAAEWRIYHGRPWIELRLRVLWVEKRRLLKLEWKQPDLITERVDGIMGGSLKRECNGREMPLRDWTILRLKSLKLTSAVIAPEIFALDGDTERIGLTLLRSCVMACHEPNPGTDLRSTFSDQGPHTFIFRFSAAPDLDPDDLESQALQFHRPPLKADVTRGMKNRALSGHYCPPNQ